MTKMIQINRVGGGDKPLLKYFATPIILFLLFPFSVFSQNHQTIGTPNTLVVSKGGLMADSALIATKGDTTNAPYKDSLGNIRYLNGNIFWKANNGIRNKWAFSIVNDTTIMQDGGFKMGLGSKIWVDSIRAATLYLGNSSNFNNTNNTLVRASNIYSLNDTLNPVNSKRGITAQCRTGFTSTPPAVYFSYGGDFEAIIKGENNQNWNSQIHPVISGVSSQVFGLSGAIGIIPKASSYYGTAAINTGLTVDELNLIDITYQHSGTINHSNGIRIADIDAGSNGIAIYNVLGDGLASPAGRYFLFDSTGYPSHFAGGIETYGLDNYLINLASSYSARSKVDKNYVDSSLSAQCVAGTYTPTLTSVTNISSSTARQCQYMRVGNTVTVSGSFQVVATTVTIQAEIGVSLPIVSNLTAIGNLGGSAGLSGGTLANALAVYVTPDVTNDRADFKLATTATTTTTADISFTFTYLIQ